MATATTFNDVRQMLRRWDKVRKLPRSRKHLEVLKITIIFFFCRGRKAHGAVCFKTSSFSVRVWQLLSWSNSSVTVPASSWPDSQRGSDYRKPHLPPILSLRYFNMNFLTHARIHVYVAIYQALTWICSWNQYQFSYQQQAGEQFTS